MAAPRRPLKRARTGAALPTHTRPKYKTSAPRAPQEVGYVDLDQAGYACNTTGQIVLIGPIAQGTTVNQRVGKHAQYKSLQLRGYFVNGSASILNAVALMIIYDKRPRETLPAITDIIEAVHPNAMRNTTNESRFKVLKRVDATLLGSSQSSDATHPQEDCSFYLPLKNLPVTFNALSTGAIDDIESGALYLVTIGNVAQGSPDADLSAAVRLRFVDP